MNEKGCVPTPDTLIYLYGFTCRKPRLEVRGEAEGETYFIFHHHVYVAVSKVLSIEFGEKNLTEHINNPVWLKEKVEKHEQIIEQIMKQTWILPSRFAVLFNNEDSLRQYLEQNAGEIKNRINVIKGKEEWGVKIYCDQERLKDVISKESTQILTIDQEIEACSPGKAFFLRKKREDIIKKILDDQIDQRNQEYFETLKKQSLGACINKLLPRELTKRKEEMILNAAFLVKKNSLPVFINTIQGLKNYYEDKGFLIDCTGPWPPYHFC